MNDPVEEGVSEGRLAEHDGMPQYRNDCQP